jgi:hypothetical protein
LVPRRRKTLLEEKKNSSRREEKLFVKYQNQIKKNSKPNFVAFSENNKKIRGWFYR